MDKDRLKLYMRQERELRKKHTDMQMQMIIFGFFMVFLVMFSCIFAFADTDGDMVAMVFMYLMMESFAFKFLCESLYIIGEKGKVQSVFAKMLYVPRNTKEMFAAKALVMLKDMGIVVIITQLITVLINIPYNAGHFVVYAETFAPLYLGVACMFAQFMAFWLTCSGAIKEAK